MTHLDEENEHPVENGRKTSFNEELTQVLYRINKEKYNGDLKLQDDSKMPKDSLYLYIVNFTVNLILFGCGHCFAWTSPMLPKLRDPTTSPLGTALTPAQESWIASVLMLGMAFGPFVGLPCADKIGRKPTLMLLIGPPLMGFFMLAFGHSFEIFCAARLLAGVGVGSLVALLPIYIGEITQDHNRGKFSCCSGIFLCLGLLYPSLAGPVLSVKWFNLSCTVALLVFCLVFPLFMPETPVYLCLKNRTDEAEEVLMKLRAKPRKYVQAELKEIMANIERDVGSKGGVVTLFKTKSTRKGLLVTCGLVCFQQFAGIGIVVAFMQTIFEASGSTIPPDVSSIVIGVVQIVAAFMTTVVVERLGRKTLLLSSLIGCGTSTALLGLYFFMKDHGFNVAPIFWLPIVCLILFVVSFNLGAGPLPWTIMSEIFPANVRTVAAAITTLTCSLSSFGITAVFPFLIHGIGMSCSFWVVAGFNLAALLFVGLIVPETKGKTLLEIQQILAGSKKR